MTLLIGNIPLDKIMFYLLLFIVLFIILVIIGNKLNYNKCNKIEHFIEPVTTKPIVPIAPTIQNAIATSYNSINNVRFNMFENQTRLNNVNERINKLNHNLVNITGKPTYSVDGKLNFY